MPIDQNMPEAYQKGFIYFCDLKINVNKNVLIPRIETEKIVDLVKEFVNKNNIKNVQIIDVGTGSGCISIALAKNLTDAKITAIDISNEALEVAVQNSSTNKVNNQIEFVQNDLLNNYYKAADIIVSNLPYIPSDYIKQLEESVKNYEPILALDGGKDGFDLYRRLFTQIIENKTNPKLIIIEIDDTQNELAVSESKKYFPDKKIELINDKYGYPRFVSIS